MEWKDLWPLMVTTVVGGFLGLIMPFIMAIIVAYILYMPCRKIEGAFNKSKIKFVEKFSRVISTVIVYILAITIIFVLFKFIIPSVSESVVDLANNIPNYLNNAVNYLSNLDEENLLYKLHAVDYVKSLQEYDLGADIINWINIENISQSIKGIMGAANVIFDIFVTLVVSFYLLLERSEIKKYLEKVFDVLFDKKTNSVFSNYYRKTNEIFFNFFTSQLLDAFIVGIVTSIVMSIMHVKYGVLLGFLIGLFNIIPYFGAIAGILIAITITIFTGGFAQAIWLAVVVTILQQIDANIINPRILGTSLNLSPILVIFSVTVGGSYFGVLGMFLGVPVTALLKLILDDFIDYSKKKKELKE